MTTPFLRTPYNYDMNKAGDESGLRCLDKTLAQQQFKDEVNINTIVERFGLTGEIPTVPHPPVYDDFTGIFDYQAAMNAVRKAQEGFMEFPAHLRARFHNDPQEMLEFLGDDDNRPEAEKLGLVKPKEPQPTVESSTPKPEAPEAPETPKPVTL